jgi:hypothetical protein
MVEVRQRTPAYSYERDGEESTRHPARPFVGHGAQMDERRVEQIDAEHVDAGLGDGR